MTTDDEFDAMIRSSFPPVAPSPERVDRVIGSVLATIEARTPRPDQTVPPWAIAAMPLPRYAMAMAIAAVLGSLCGVLLPNASKVADQPPLLSLITISTATKPLGF
jgi:hypothetical protein